jgi:hypothetical protein
MFGDFAKLFLGDSENGEDYIGEDESEEESVISHRPTPVEFN